MFHTSRILGWGECRWHLPHRTFRCTSTRDNARTHLSMSFSPSIKDPKLFNKITLPNSSVWRKCGWGQLCIETLCKRATSVAHLTNFSFEFFCKIFTEDASRPLLYHGAKKSKMTKNSNQGGGSCLNPIQTDQKLKSRGGSCLNPIQTRLFLGSKNQRGGGTLCPPSKNPVTLLRIHSSKLFLKACPKMNLLTKLWFPWKPWLGF